jgi:hypothetical protein
VLGGAGEALLVPLAVWNGGRFSDDDCYDQSLDTICDFWNGYTPSVDTIIEVWIPQQMGQDAIPNNYTAVNTTNPPPFTTPTDARVNWFWFDERGVKRAEGDLLLQPDQVAQISLTEALNGRQEGKAGYMVFTSNTDTNASAGQGNFAFFANAWITGALTFDRPQNRPFVGIGFPLIGATIPVLAMNDGPDSPRAPGQSCPSPTASDRVTYAAGQTPCLVSPAASGFRPGNNNGQQNTFVFDLALSDRYSNTIHVIWFDQNLDRPFSSPEQRRTFGGVYPNNLIDASSDVADVKVFNTTAFPSGAGSSVELPNRLNVIWIPPAYDEDPDNLAFINEPFNWTTGVLTLPLVNDPAINDTLQTGFASYTIDEYVDSGQPVGPEIAGFAFAIKYSGLLVDNEDLEANDPDAIVLMIESSLGHDRGNY